MKTTSKKLTAILLAMMLASGLGLTACSEEGATDDSADSTTTDSSGDDTTDDSVSTEVVTISFPTYEVGTHTSAEHFAEVVRLFEEEYGDTIQLEIEELPSDDSYTDKLKVLAATNDLPDVIDGKNGVRDLAISNGQAMDWTDELAADPEYAAEIGQAAIDAMTVDGKVYSISDSNVTVGYFYNKDMFADCGIEPATTWEEFMDHCETLSQNGYTPLALMTGENSWTTNLILCSMVGTNGETGNDFMNTQYPETYQTDEMVEALTMMQTLFQDYTTADAVGAIYSTAANSFCQGQTAMIANGLWMSGTFSDPDWSPDGFVDSVGFSVYPENGLVSNYDIGYVVCSDTEEEREAAVTLVKFLTNEEAQARQAEMLSVVPINADTEISQDFLDSDPFFSLLLEAKQSITYEYMNFDLAAYAGVVDAFGIYYPELVYDMITPEEMTVKLDEAAAASK